MFFGKDKKTKKKTPDGSNGGDDILGATENFEEKVDNSKSLIDNIDKLLKETEGLSSVATPGDLEERKLCGC